MAPSLVQSVSATGTASPLPVTLGASTTAGNCLVICITGTAATSNPNVTAVTLGGAAGNFAQVITAGNVTADNVTTSIWADPNCAGGQTALSLTFSATGSPSICVTTMEWSGLALSSVTDKTSSGLSDTTVTSWSSGATATTSQASEVAIGCVGGQLSTGITTITGPSSPWTNFTQETSANTHIGLLAGYQVLSSTGTVTYSGTFAAGYQYTAAVATFKAAAAAAADNSPYVIAQNTGFF
jgi:hypothetical protein